jgi:hypothetical protein
VNSGDSATFNCSVSGSPIESVWWLRNGDPVLSMSEVEAPSGSRIRLLSQLVLHVAGVTRTDRGMYQCFVRNDKENAQGSAELRLGGEFSCYGLVRIPVERLSEPPACHFTTRKSMTRFACNFYRSLVINKITVKTWRILLKRSYKLQANKGHKRWNFTLQRAMKAILYIKVEGVHSVVCMRNTLIIFISVKHNSYYLMTIIRLRVWTLWGASSGLYKVLKNIQIAILFIEPQRWMGLGGQCHVLVALSPGKGPGLLCTKRLYIKT